MGLCGISLCSLDGFFKQYPQGLGAHWRLTPTWIHPIAIPSGNIALPLGDPLLLATKEKILRGEFVDLFSLLYRNLEKKDKGQLDDRENKILKRRKIDRPGPLG